MTLDGLGQRIRRVRVHGRAIDKEFTLHIALDGCLDGGFDRLVVADAGKDDVGFGDGLFDGRDDGGFARGKFGGEIRCALLRAVVDDKRGGEFGFLDEVFDHALS